jgi:hypothetical protein
MMFGRSGVLFGRSVVLTYVFVCVCVCVCV